MRHCMVPVLRRTNSRANEERRIWDEANSGCKLGICCVDGLRDHCIRVPWTPRNCNQYFVLVKGFVVPVHTTQYWNIGNQIGEREDVVEERRLTHAL